MHIAKGMGVSPGMGIWEIPAGGLQDSLHLPCAISAQATGQAARSTRTIVIAGVPAGLLQDDVMADILTIHFQMSRNNGGDVEEVTYPTRNKGVAYVTFEDREGISINVLKHSHPPKNKPKNVDPEPNDFKLGFYRAGRLKPLW